MTVSVVTVETSPRVTIVVVPGISTVTTVSVGVGVKLIVVTRMFRVVMTSKLVVVASVVPLIPEKVTSVEVVSEKVNSVSEDSIVTLVVTPGTVTVTEDPLTSNTVSDDSTTMAVTNCGMVYKVVLSGMSVDPSVVSMVKVVPSMSVVVGSKTTVVDVVAEFVTTSSVLITVTSVEVESTLSSVVGASSPAKVVS